MWDWTHTVKLTVKVIHARDGGHVVPFLALGQSALNLLVAGRLGQGGDGVKNRRTGNGSVRRAAEVIFHFSMIAPPVLALRSGLHLGYLDSLRGLSALYVAACHAYLMYATDFASMGVRSASGALLVGTSWVMFGRAAVAVFIVLSGYCLMLPIVRSPGQEWRVAFWPFMRRRAWRILPPYYGALACSAALIVLVPALDDPSIREWHKSFPAFGTGSVVSHLLLVHNYFPAYQYAIDHPLWSIATEWQIYFLFPLLLWIGKRQGDFSIVVTAGAITMALNLYLLNFSPQHNPWPPQFVGLFGFGMACAAWSFPHGSSAPLDAQRWRRQAIVLLVAGAVASVVFISTRQQQLPDLLIGGGIGCAMVFLTNAVLTGSRPVALRVLERPSLVALGRFSYSLYLLHAPLLALFYLLARSLNLTPLAFQLFILGVGLPITVAVCYVFHLVFERPFIRRRDAMSSSIAGSGISERVTVA